MYLEINQSIDQTIDLIKNSIYSGTPLSISRFGDGEIYLLNRNSPDSHKIRKCKDWDYKYPEEVNEMYDDANNILIKSLKNSDIISIMDKNNIISKRIGFSNERWSISKELLLKNGINPEQLKVTDHMLARDVKFGKPENFKNIIQGKSLNIISPNTEELKTKNLETLLDCEVTYTNHPFSINFKNRHEFVDNLKNIKSDVVLVGTGNIKDYVSILSKQYGKVAIDVGAMLDAWAGIKSRPWFKKGGHQNHLLL